MPPFTEPAAAWLGPAAVYASLAVAFGLSRGALAERWSKAGPRLEGLAAAAGALGVWAFCAAGRRAGLPLSPRVAALSCSAALSAAYLFLSRAAAGRCLRACVDDVETAVLMGIDADRCLLLGLALAALLAVLAGLFAAVCAPQAATALGCSAAFLAAAVGGASSLRGAALGGAALGLLGEACASWAPPHVVLAGSLALCCLALALWPAGLIGGGRAGRI